MEARDTGAGVAGDEQVRSQAIRQIKRKREFRGNVVLYLLVNAVLWAIWALTGAETDDLWPAWVSGIWGFFLLLEARHVYADRSISEREIQEEMRQIHR
jgi:hypothetical protein